MKSEKEEKCSLLVAMSDPEFTQKNVLYFGTKVKKKRKKKRKLKYSKRKRSN